MKFTSPIQYALVQRDTRIPTLVAKKNHLGKGGTEIAAMLLTAQQRFYIRNQGFVRAYALMVISYYYHEHQCTYARTNAQSLLQNLSTADTTPGLLSTQIVVYISHSKIVTIRETSLSTGLPDNIYLIVRCQVAKNELFCLVFVHICYNWKHEKSFVRLSRHLSCH